MIRIALVVLLVAAAPLGLICHALPQTEGVAMLWWRAFIGMLAIQVGQSFGLIAALRVFFAAGGDATLGLASGGGVVTGETDLAVSFPVLNQRLPPRRARRD